MRFLIMTNYFIEEKIGVPSMPEAGTGTGTDKAWFITVQLPLFIRDQSVPVHRMSTLLFKTLPVNRR
jgi:hypothetical protein